jgi:L-seryl-tRNA(Ser) seleniumtransferase
MIELYGRESFLKATREVLDDSRREILEFPAPRVEEGDLVPENILKKIGSHLEQKLASSLRRAVNATGIVIHTGLGRAVLAQSAIETGLRGHRDVHINRLLCELTGAEAGILVNNNAAATVLILNTLAKGKEVILSRGQLVEIGGSFRLPEVMETSGALLREVGTTNKTHLKDYEAAINEKTGAIMRVHHSNYRIMGFAEEPEIEELVELAKKHNLPVIDDLGSGALVDLKEYGLETEPMVQRSINAGADVVCFSGDKLIGGPQSGVIVGKADIVNRIKKNPLMRAFRVGKLTIASMEATLKLFLNSEKLKERHPTYKMFSLSLKEINKRAAKVANKLRRTVSERARVWVEDGESQVGSGSVPVETIPTKVLSIKAFNFSPESLTRKLRGNEPPIFSRVYKETVLLDFRTIQPDEDKLVEEALLKILTE